MVMHSIREYENEIYMPLLGFALCMCHAIPAAYLKKKYHLLFFLHCNLYWMYIYSTAGWKNTFTCIWKSITCSGFSTHCSLAQKPNKIKVIAIAYFSMPEHTKIRNNFNLLGFCANLTCTGRETSACDWFSNKCIYAPRSTVYVHRPMMMMTMAM